MMNMKRVKEEKNKRTPSLLHHLWWVSGAAAERERAQTHPSDTQIESDGRVGVEEKVFPYRPLFIYFFFKLFISFFPLTGAVCGTKQVRS